ncbi:MAG: hypothetical protein ACT4PU_08410 [Planctomycetota bacterium]
MADGSTQDPPVPIWLILWLGFVLAALLVPAEFLQRHVIQPFIEQPGEQQTPALSPESQELVMRAMVPVIRMIALGLAGLYLALRVLTRRARQRRHT